MYKKDNTKNEGEMLDYIMKNLTPAISVIFLNEKVPCNHYNSENSMTIEEYDDNYVQCHICGHKILRHLIKDVYNKLIELEELVK